MQPCLPPQLYGYDKEGPSPSEEDNNVVFQPISLDKMHSIECYVLDVVDPLTQSTQLGIDLYIQPYTQLSGLCWRVNNIQHIALYCFECLLSKEVSSTTTLLSSEVEGPYGSYPYNCGGRHACSG